MALDLVPIELPEDIVSGWSLYTAQMSTGDEQSGSAEFEAFLARPGPVLLSELNLSWSRDDYTLTTLVPGHESFAGEHTRMWCFVNELNNRIALILLKE